ncbi:MAG: lipopolysaccharide biosynthesis protein, partial [Erysipelotrichaceae bacterium]
NGFYGRVLGGTLASLLMSIPLLITLLRKVKLHYLVDDGKSALSLSIPLIFHMISGQILNASDRYILQNYISEAQLAVYSFIYSVSTIIQMVWGSINNAWVPWYYENLRDQNHSVVKRNSIIYIFVFTTLTIGFLLVAPEIVLILGGKEYRDSLQYLSVLVLGNYGVFMYSFYVNFQFFKQNTRIIPIATMFAAAINIALNLVFIPRYGIWAASFSTLISYFFMFLFHYCVVRFQYRHEDFPVWILLATFAVVSGLALVLQLTSYNLMVRIVLLLVVVVILIFQTKKLYLSMKR